MAFSRSSSWRIMATFIASGSCSHKRVDPSRSVSRKVTVPDGRCRAMTSKTTVADAVRVRFRQRPCELPTIAFRFRPAIESAQDWPPCSAAIRPGGGRRFWPPSPAALRSRPQPTPLADQHAVAGRFDLKRPRRADALGPDHVVDPAALVLDFDDL